MNEEEGKGTLNNQPINKSGRPHYLFDMQSRWERWTNIKDSDVLEGLDYLSGDLFFEMRKLTAQMCLTNEDTEKKVIRKIVEILKLREDEDKMKEVGRELLAIMGAEKQKIREMIDNSWKEIVDKQKIGVDKICFVVTRHILEKSKDKS